MITKNWFPHDVDARKDDKLSAIMVKYGIVGYALYFILLETMRGKSEFKIKICDISTIETIGIIPFMKNGDKIDLKEFLDFCCTKEVGAFKFRNDKQSPENSHYYSSGFRKRMEKFDKGRQKMSKGGKKGAATKYGTKDEETMRNKYGDENFEIAKRVIEKFNEETDKNFKIFDYSVNLIVNRLGEGFTESDCIQVIENKKNNSFLKERGHINIKTFFAVDKFESYLHESDSTGNGQGEGTYVPGS